MASTSYARLRLCPAGHVFNKFETGYCLGFPFLEQQNGKLSTENVMKFKSDMIY